MNDRQFLWGLSAGASALAVGGFFWSGVCGAALAARGWWAAWGIAAALQFGVSVVLLWAAVRLRRRSGFVRSDLRQTNPDQRQATRRMVKAFIWVVLGQLSAIALAIWWCVHTGRKDLVFPVIGLIVSLHFVPLGRVFHVRPYYLTGLAGSVLCLPALFIPLGASRLAWFEGAMAVAMWLSGWYVIRNADQITARALQERWAG